MSNLFLTVFGISIACSIVILIVMLFDRIFQKGYSRKWKYVIWAVIAVRLIMPINLPFTNLSLPLPIVQTESNPSDVATSLSTSSSSQVPLASEESTIATNMSNTRQSESSKQTSTTTDLTDSKESNPYTDTSNTPNGNETGDNKGQLIPSLGINLYSVISVAAIIWIIGAMLYLGYHLLAYLHFQKKIQRWGTFIRQKELLSLIDDLRMDLGIKKQITLMRSKLVTSPILLGFVRPTIVLPDIEFTMEQSTFILKHELIHYKHRDLFYKILLLIAATLHWFNPMVHIMAFQANNDMELYCDEILVGRSDVTYRETYSMTLVKVMKGSNRAGNLLLSTNFSGRKKQVRNRFRQIMNARPTKKGTSLIVCFVCSLLILSNLVACSAPPKAEALSKGQATISDTNSEVNAQDTLNEAMKGTSSLLENTSNILILGLDGNGEISRSDSILIVRVNPTTGKITLTSFLRDMYLDIPGQGKNKLGAAFSLGGIDLVKKTLESNFNIKIDHTLIVNMIGFENIIDTIGGVEVELTKEEADYLNSTNYISKKSNRNVIAGKQILNGNQALGYVRVRHIPTAQGVSNDLGRTDRLRSLLTTVIKKSLDKDFTELTNLLSITISNVVTDMTKDQVLTYLNTLLQKDTAINSIMIPAEGSFTSDVVDGMSVIIPDLEACKKLLEGE